MEPMPVPPDDLPVGSILQVPMQPTHTRPFLRAGYNEEHSVMAIESMMGVIMNKTLLVRYVSLSTWREFQASGYSVQWFEENITAHLGPPEEGGTYQYTFANSR
jgi:hypothetical protein